MERQNRMTVGSLTCARCATSPSADLATPWVCSRINWATLRSAVLNMGNCCSIFASKGLVIQIGVQISGGTKQCGMIVGDDEDGDGGQISREPSLVFEALTEGRLQEVAAQLGHNAATDINASPCPQGDGQVAGGCAKDGAKGVQRPATEIVRAVHAVAADGGGGLQARLAIMVAA